MSVKSKLDRNNTDFPLMLTESLKQIQPASEYSFLLHYQNIVREYMHMNVSRGLLVHHEMGLGKSILAVAIAIDFMQTLQPIILLTKSLTDNMKSSVRKYIIMRAEVDPAWPIGRISGTELDAWIDTNFSFVSMNASNMIKQVDRAAAGEIFEIEMLEDSLNTLRSQNLNGKLLIVDEAHNLFRAITNGSRNGRALYDLVMKSDCKLVFLTGTPISNNPFELVPCFNMLGGDILPIDYNEFSKLYIGEDGAIANKGYFQNRIMGLVSSVQHKYANSTAEFPRRTDLEVVTVEMDPIQYVNYELARDKERLEGTKSRGSTISPLTKPKSRSTSTYRVRSRQLSNYDPDAKTQPKFDAIYERLSRPGIALLYSQFVTSGIKPFCDYLEKNGWEMHSLGKSSHKSGGAYIHDTMSTDNYVGAALAYIDNMLNEVDPDITSGSLSDDDENASTLIATVDVSAVDVSAVDVSAVDVSAVDASIVSTADASVSDNTNDDSQYNIFDALRAGDDEATVAASEAVSEAVSEATLAATEAASEAASEAVVVSGSNKCVGCVKCTSCTGVVGGCNNCAGPCCLNIFGAMEPLKYIIISGEVDVDTRSAIAAMINSPENAHGELCKLLIVSSTGAEGLDLKRIRNIHIMEPYWNWGRIEQIIARGVRNNSHIDLPPEEKEVSSFIYLSVPPSTGKKINGTLIDTTDVELYNDAVRSNITNNSFIDAISEASIECTLLKGAENCRVCAPTHARLYSSDPAVDIMARDPCQRLESETISVKPVVVDDVEYYYADSDSVFGITAYKMDPIVNGYIRIEESDPLFDRILDATGKSIEVL